MDSKEEEAKRLTDGHHEQPPPYPGGYGYPSQGQAYGYPPQQQQAGQYGQPQYPQQYQPQGQMVGHHCHQPLVNQPGAYPQQVIIVTPAVMPNAPPDHLVFNIIMTLCCCWPIGIFAIVKSLECRTAIQGNDRQRAENLSRSAKRLGMWTLGVGIATVAIFVVIFAVTFIVVPQHYNNY